MDGRQHSKGYFLSLLLWIPLYIYLRLYLYIPLLIIGNSIVDCDEDQKWRGGKWHRSLITHSLLWPLIIGLCIYLPFCATNISFMKIFVTLVIPIIVHLYLDLYAKDEEGKWVLIHQNRGKYLIGKLNYTRLFILGNIAAGIILLFIFL